MKRTYRIKVFIDTNVLIDYLIPGRLNHTPAVDLFSLILTSTIEATFSTQSVLDVAYIGKKYDGFSMSAFRQTMNMLLARTNASYIDTMDLRTALQDPNEDLEDNAQIAFACAQRCDVIITYDRKMLSRTAPAPLMIMTTEDFLARWMVTGGNMQSG